MDISLSMPAMASDCVVCPARMPVTHLHRISSNFWLLDIVSFHMSDFCIFPRRGCGSLDTFLNLSAQTSTLMTVTSILAKVLNIPSLQVSEGAKSVSKSPDRVTIVADNLKNMSQRIGGPMADSAKTLQALADNLHAAPSRHVARAALKEVHNIGRQAAESQRAVSHCGASGSWNDMRFRQFGEIGEAAKDLLRSPHKHMPIAGGSPAMEASGNAGKYNSDDAMLNLGDFRIPRVQPPHTGPKCVSRTPNEAVDPGKPQRSNASEPSPASKKNVTFDPTVTVHRFPRDS